MVKSPPPNAPSPGFNASSNCDKSNGGASTAGGGGGSSSGSGSSGSSIGGGGGGGTFAISAVRIVRSFEGGCVMTCRIGKIIKTPNATTPASTRYTTCFKNCSTCLDTSSLSLIIPRSNAYFNRTRQLRLINHPNQ